MKRLMVTALGLIFGLGFAATAMAEPMTFGLGDVVYKRDLKEPLPNAFGGKDIWGRKRTVGAIELRYLGLDGRTAVFARRDTQILTNETTVNRSGMVFGSVGGSSVMLAGVGQGPNIQHLAPSEVAIRVDLESDRSLVIDGAVLQVVSAAPNKVVVDIPAAGKK